jgi:hypothetical protein
MLNRSVFTTYCTLQQRHVQQVSVHYMSTKSMFNSPPFMRNIFNGSVCTTHSFSKDMSTDPLSLDMSNRSVFTSNRFNRDLLNRSKNVQQVTVHYHPFNGDMFNRSCLLPAGSTGTCSTGQSTLSVSCYWEMFNSSTFTTHPFNGDIFNISVCAIRSGTRVMFNRSAFTNHPFNRDIF